MVKTSKIKIERTNNINPICGLQEAIRSHLEVLNVKGIKTSLWDPPLDLGHQVKPKLKIEGSSASLALLKIECCGVVMQEGIMMEEGTQYPVHYCLKCDKWF
jgi:hypothetical protein